MAQVNPLENHPKYQQIGVDNLGDGNFGFVKRARIRDTGEGVAVKFLPRGPQKISKYVEREILHHRQLHGHPHVVQFKEVFLTPRHLGIVMEFAAGGDMYSYVTGKPSGRLTEQEARPFFQQLIVGLDYCHQKKIVNRDVKLENTLLSSADATRVVKICDFGYSKHESNSQPSSRVGTIAYAAPEVLEASRDKAYDGKMADVWSCGVMLYVMLSGEYPFSRPNDLPAVQLRRMEQRIRQLDYTPLNPNWSAECRDLLSKILTKEPERITMQGICTHPWFVTGLTPELRELNVHLLAGGAEVAGQLPADTQSEEEIIRILAEARMLPNELLNPHSQDAGAEQLDAYVDVAMGEEML